MVKTADLPQFGPLHGVRVVNLTQAIAGPFATCLLADMGADVIGVENPHGRGTSRPNRALGGWGTILDRRNTRSLCVDVRKGRGRELFLELLKTADILIEGFRGGQMVRWGMGDKALWEVNPKLVIGHISGFGQTGVPEYVARASFDGIGQAFSGFMEMNGFPDRPPALAFPQVSDYYSGFMCLAGVLAAYSDAQRTGKGDSVDVAQYEAMVRCEGYYVVNYLNTGTLPVREGSHSATSAGYGTYVCKDGVELYVLLLGAGVLRTSLPVVGIEYGKEPFFDGIAVVGMDTAAGRFLEAALAEFFDNNTGEEAERILLDHGVPCSRIFTFEMTERDPQYLARETYTSWANAYDDGVVSGVNVAPKLKSNPGKIWRGMPLVGQDNADLLEELGCSEGNVRALYAKGCLRREHTPFG